MSYFSHRALTILAACVSVAAPVAAQDGGSVSIQSVRLTRSGDADPVGSGERITAHLTLSDNVTVSGTPAVALTVGRQTRLARYAAMVGPLPRPYLVFLYEVQSADVDTDGIGFDLAALHLNGGAIRDSKGAEVRLDLDRFASYRSPFGVDGGVDNPPKVRRLTLYTPGADRSERETYGLGERITVGVTFTEPVVVTGTPTLELTIGPRTRPAAYQYAATTLDATILYFAYQVEASDLDPDGVSVDTAALVLNGGSIRDMGGTAADLDLRNYAVVNDAGRKVDGRIDNPPELSVFVNAPGGGRDTFGLGARIRAGITVSERVTVTGEPTLGLTLGSRTRQMQMYRLRESEGGRRSWIYFHYDVQASDLDEDGPSVAADALSLNGGSIRDVTGTDAEPVFVAPVTDAPDRAVNGSVDTGAPAVTRMGFQGRPRAGDTYRVGDLLEIYVTFDKALNVIGTPGLAVNIGGQTRRMTYEGIYSSGVSLRFSYAVQAADRDVDGIEVGPLAVTAGAAIRDELQGRAANLSLADAVHISWVGRKVDGGR